MPSPVRFLLIALALVCHGALAQTLSAVPPTLSVQRLAPQLVAFAGSQANFQSLVTGLAQGTQVQLVTLLPDGFTQVVTFTPTTVMSPADIARVLESARQQLIGLGIANPTAEQIGITLMGGTVPTALGGTQVTGLISPQSPPSPAAQIQSGAAGASAPGTTPATVTTPAVTSNVNVQIFPGSATSATSATTPRVNTSDSLAPAGATSRSPLPPGTTSATPGQPATTPPPSPQAGLLGAPAAPAPPASSAPAGSSNAGLSAR